MGIMENELDEIKSLLGGTWKLHRTDNFEEALKAMGKFTYT